MLFSEHILFCLTLYNSFMYGLPYLLFEAFPIEYDQHRDWALVESSLVFLAVLVGVVVSGCNKALYQPYFWKQLDKAHEEGKKNIPEARLPPMMLGGCVVCCGVVLVWWQLAHE
jgi:DHA1 family multidrug resistance protein-like MFS transporter